MRYLLLCWLMLGCLSNGVARETIHIVRGNGDYFPKEYVEEGVLKGLHLDLIHAVAEQLEVNVEFESLPWKRAMAELRYGNYDAMTYMSRTQEREQFALFLKGNIISSSQVYPIVLAERKIEIQFDGSVQSLQPYVIAVGDGYKYGEPFDSAVRLKRYILPSPDQLTLTELLRHHRVDVIISSRRNLRKVLSQHQIDEQFHIFPQPVATDNSYIAFTKARDTGLIAEKFSSAISVFKTTKPYLDLLDYYKKLEENRQIQH